MDQFYFEEDGYFESRYFVYVADSNIGLGPYLVTDYLNFDYLETRGSYSSLAIDFDVVVGAIVDAYGSLSSIISIEILAVKTVSAESSISATFTQNTIGYRLKDIDLFAFSDAALTAEANRLRDNNISVSGVFNVATDTKVFRSLIAEPASLFDIAIANSRSRAFNIETQTAFSFDSTANRNRDVSSSNGSSFSVSVDPLRIQDGNIDITSSATIIADIEIIASAVSELTISSALSATAINLEGVDLTAFTNASVSVTANYVTNASSNLNSAFTQTTLASYNVIFRIQPLGFNATLIANTFKPGNIIFEKIGTGLAEIDNNALKLAKISTASGIIRSTVASSNHLYYSLPTTAQAGASTGWRSFDISFDIKFTNNNDSPGVFLKSGLDASTSYHTWTIGSTWLGAPANVRVFELKVWPGSGGARTFTFQPRLGTSVGGGNPDWTTWNNIRLYSRYDGLNGSTPVITLRYQVNNLTNFNNDSIGSARDIALAWNSNNEQIEFRNDITSPLWLDNVYYYPWLPYVDAPDWNYTTPYPSEVYKGFNLTFDGTFNQIYYQSFTGSSTSSAAFSLTAKLSGPVKFESALASQFSATAIIGKLNEINLTAFTNASINTDAVIIARTSANVNVEATASTQSIRIRDNDGVLETNANITVDSNRYRDITSTITAFTSVLGLGIKYESLSSELSASFDTLRRYIEDSTFESGYFEQLETNVVITAQAISSLNSNFAVSTEATVDHFAYSDLTSAYQLTADIAVTKQLASSLTTSFSDTINAIGLFESTATMASDFAIDCRAITTDQIELIAFTNADLLVSAERYRGTEIDISANATFYVDTSDSLNVFFNADLSSAFTQTNQLDRFRTTSIELQGWATQIAVTEKTVEVNCNITATFTQSNQLDRFRTTAVTISTSASTTTTAVKLAVGVITISSAMTFVAGVRDLRIDEIEYKIPGESWNYKIGSESRIIAISSESRIYNIHQETAIKNIDSETREYIII